LLDMWTNFTRRIGIRFSVHDDGRLRDETPVGAEPAEPSGELTALTAPGAERR
jgi:hypothetical protein